MTGIKQPDTTNIAEVRSASIYNMSGMKLNTLSHGINILRKTDGKTVKILK